MINPLLICTRCRSPSFIRKEDSLDCPCSAHIRIEEEIPLFSPSAMNDCAFDAERLTHIAQMEASHFWFKGRRSLIKRWLAQILQPPARIADLGCGTGLLTEELLQQGYEVIGVDVHPKQLATLQKKWPQALLFQSTVEKIPIESGSCDAILFLDVLEHVNDQQSVAEAYRLLRKGGKIIITVPAHQWLWSRRDENAGHCRRYSRTSLLSLLKDGGFAIDKIRYYQSCLFPIFVLSRLASRLFPTIEQMEGKIPFLLNRIFSWINECEARWDRSFPFGSTLVTMGTKCNEL